MIPQSKLGELYQIELTDTAPDRFMVSIKPKSLKNLAQINPTDLNQFGRRYRDSRRPPSKSSLYVNSVFLLLKFKVDEKSVKDTFEVKLLSDSFDIEDRHFNYQSGKEESYAFQYIFSQKSQLGIEKKNLVVSQVSPLNYKAGDFLTIYGENLNSHLDKIHCPCDTKKEGLRFFRYCKITDDMIVQSSFDKVTFKVPSEFNYNHDGLGKMKPTSGRIKVKYTLSKESLNLIE